MSDAVFVKITVSGNPDLLQQCAAAHFANGSFDYNSVIPMPAELNIEESSSVTTGYDALYGDWTEPAKYWTWKEAATSLGMPFPLESREQLLACIRSLDCAAIYLEPARQYKENIDRFGHGSWYGWCKQHWGTKWNAEDSAVTLEPQQLVVTFTATNAFPKPVVSALSRKWPELDFKVLYVDEYLRWGRDFSIRNGKETAKVKRSPSEVATLMKVSR